MISYDKLDELIVSSPKVNIVNKAKCLVAALNDWPTSELNEPSELVHELNRLVSGELIFENLSNYSEKLNVVTDAWKLEAMTSLLEMFDKEDIENRTPLETIIRRISGEIK